MAQLCEIVFRYIHSIWCAFSLSTYNYNLWIKFAWAKHLKCMHMDTMHKCIIYVGCLVYSCLGIAIYKTVIWLYICRYVLAKEVANDYKITCWNSLRKWASLLSKQLTVVGRGPWYYVCIEYCSNTAYYVCTYVCISAIYPLILAV